MHRFFKGFIQMNLSFILNHGANILMKMCAILYHSFKVMFHFYTLLCVLLTCMTHGSALTFKCQ